MLDPLKLRDSAVGVAEEAAAKVRATVGPDQIPRMKSSPTDVVTDADLEAETFIRARLGEMWPGSGFLGEEMDDHSGEDGVDWVIDPIDGTVNFYFGVPIAAVSLGARVDGQVVAGAIASIYQPEIYSCARGGGSQLNGAAIKIREQGDLSQALVATGFSYDGDLRRRQGEIVKNLLPRVRDVRCFGSAALQLCWVASGRLDAYFESDLRYWDHAAGALIAQEAGARVETFDSPLGELLVAARPGLFDGLCVALDL